MEFYPTLPADASPRSAPPAALCCAASCRPAAKCDISTLARQAGVSRAALYRSYPHLKAEFKQQLARQREAGQAPDPHEDQITRLKARTAGLDREPRPPGR